VLCYAILLQLYKQRVSYCIVLCCLIFMLWLVPYPCTKKHLRNVSKFYSIQVDDGWLFTLASFILIMPVCHICPHLSSTLFGLPPPLQQKILGRSDALTWNRTLKYPRRLYLVVIYTCTHRTDTSFSHKTEVMYCLGFLFCIKEEGPPTTGSGLG